MTTAACQTCARYRVRTDRDRREHARAARAVAVNPDTPRAAKALERATRQRDEGIRRAAEHDRECARR